MVVDIVYELEDLLEDDDGYGGDRDEGESKSSRSFREDAARLERRAASAFAAGDDSDFSHEHAALHDEFRELVEARVEATLGERRFTPSQFVARLKAVGYAFELSDALPTGESLAAGFKRNAAGEKLKATFK